MKSVKDRLVYFLSTLPNKKGGIGMTKGAFQTKTGLKTGAIDNIGRSLHQETVNKIKSHYPELNEMWLLHGQEPMLIGEGHKKPVITPEFNKTIIKIKLSYVQRLTSLYQREQQKGSGK